MRGYCSLHSLIQHVHREVTPQVLQYTSLDSGNLNKIKTRKPARLPLGETRSKGVVVRHVIHITFSIIHFSALKNFEKYFLFYTTCFLSQVFPRHQLLVVNGDHLIEDPVSQLQRIEKFLNLEPRITRHNFYFNHTKGFFCLRNETADKCLRESKGRRHPRVDPTVISKLRRFFSEHNQKFYELVGEDLGWPEE